MLRERPVNCPVRPRYQQLPPSIPSVRLASVVHDGGKSRRTPRLWCLSPSARRLHRRLGGRYGLCAGSTESQSGPARKNRPDPPLGHLAPPRRLMSTRARRIRQHGTHPGCRPALTASFPRSGLCRFARRIAWHRSYHSGTRRAPRPCRGTRWTRLPVHRPRSRVSEPGGSGFSIISGGYRRTCRQSVSLVWLSGHWLTAGSLWKHPRSEPPVFAARSIAEATPRFEFPPARRPAGVSSPLRASTSLCTRLTGHCPSFAAASRASCWAESVTGLVTS